MLLATEQFVTTLREMCVCKRTGVYNPAPWYNTQ